MIINITYLFRRNSFLCTFFFILRLLKVMLISAMCYCILLSYFRFTWHFSAPWLIKNLFQIFIYIFKFERWNTWCCRERYLLFPGFLLWCLSNSQVWANRSWDIWVQLGSPTWVAGTLDWKWKNQDSRSHSDMWYRHSWQQLLYLIPTASTVISF